MGCLFCDIAAGTVPAHHVYGDEHVDAFLDKSPLFLGHTLVVPRRHVVTLDEAPPELLAPLFGAVQRVMRGVVAAAAAGGTFVAMNNGVSQSVAHLHVHVVPRKKGDGMKGFFWPRHKYQGEEDAAEWAARIRAAIDAAS